MNDIIKLYGEFAKVEPQDDGTIKVYGYASSEAVDGDGEIMSADAMKAALPDYMKFGAVREMHQPSAAGTCIEAKVEDDGKTWFGAHIVDPLAVKKVETNVYKGFSVGGKIKSRDELNKAKITGIKLIEVSLVDRPSNPDAVFTMYKADDIDKESTVEKAAGEQNPADKTVAAVAGLDQSPAGNSLEVTGTDDDVIKFAALLNERKMSMADAIAELSKVAERKDVNPKEGESKYGDVKYADEKNKKYPIDTEKHIRAAWNYINKGKNAGKYDVEDVKSIKAKIVAAWKDKIDKDGPPAAEKVDAPEDLRKGMYSVSSFASTLESIASLCRSCQYEADWEGDNSDIPEKLRGWVASGIEIFKAMAAEEADEMLEELTAAVGATMAMNAKNTDLAKAGARHSKDDMDHLQEAHDRLAKLGAMCSKANLPEESADAKAKDGEAAAGEKVAKGAIVADDRVEKLLGEVKTLQERLQKVEATPAATPRTALRVVAKGQDSGLTDAPTVPQFEPIYKADGSIDKAASIVKFTHSLGGFPLYTEGPVSND